MLPLRSTWRLSFRLARSPLYRCAQTSCLSRNYSVREFFNTLPSQKEVKSDGDGPIQQSTPLEHPSTNVQDQEEGKHSLAESSSPIERGVIGNALKSNHSINSRPQLTYRPLAAKAKVGDRPSKQNNPDYVTIRGVHLPKVLLRDACKCAKCVDSSSTQKNFQTTDIPINIEIRNLMYKNGNVVVTWNNDVPGFDSDHVSTYPLKSLTSYRRSSSLVHDHSRGFVPQFWDATKIKRRLEFMSFEDYMTSDRHLYHALKNLDIHGLILIRGVPDSEKSVEDLAGRMGNIRDTLYGRTWDVKSVPDAKNVAYTSQFLGLHMDLLYMANPPGFQFLHCLKSTAKGGASLFADSYRVLHGEDNIPQVPIAYHYKNAGEYYYYVHPLVELDHLGKIHAVNYSPPFQANYMLPQTANPADVNQGLEFLRKFAKGADDPKNVLEYRLQEGECVIFNNRRLLHGRKQFDALGGERWLKGTYVDADVMASRRRVLRETFESDDISPKLVFEDLVLPTRRSIHHSTLDNVSTIDGEESAPAMEGNGEAIKGLPKENSVELPTEEGGYVRYGNTESIQEKKQD
ncbi:hypothetical protein BGZ60DRAFT_404818 [Tricladium varicosporioides]|nr:hypothetical protein BGZ60DRAFT_404818 [Hymenoscyphus varicosporioides]